MHFLLALLCIVALAGAEEENKTTIWHEPQGKVKGQHAPQQGAGAVDTDANLAETEKKKKILMRRWNEPQVDTRPLGVLESDGNMALSKQVEASRTNESPEWTDTHTNLMRRERGEKGGQHHIALHESWHRQRVASSGSRTKPTTLRNEGSKDEYGANDSEEKRLLNQFASDDEQALLELDSSTFEGSMSEALTRKNPTPAPTPSPTPRPLPARSGHCFQDEEFWSGKCYKKCSKYIGARRRSWGFGNDGYTKRIGKDTCAKESSCEAGEEQIGHRCYKNCASIPGVGGLYGLRTGEYECSMADLSESNTDNNIRNSLKSKHFRSTGGQWGGCGGYEVRGSHCGYTTKCPAVPRPELANCDELYPGFHPTISGKR